jgi:hypothetical protein
MDRLSAVGPGGSARGASLLKGEGAESKLGRQKAYVYVNVK